MTRRSVRVTLVCLGLLLTAALAYRLLVVEQSLSSERQQLSSIDTSIDDVLLTLADVRGVLHAYVAPGQRSAAWEARSAALFDKLRQQLIALDVAADSSGRSLSDSLDNLDQLTAAEKRVQHYLDFSQPLLAGDVIFTEIRDLVDATATQVSSVRDALRQDANSRIEKARREQAMLLGGGTGLWLTLAFLLALLPATAKGQAAGAPATPSAAGPESFDLSLTPRAVAAATPEPPVAAAAEPEAPVENLEVLRWRSISSICKELSSVSEVSSLSAAFARACDALGAKDGIVWVASADGTTLSPLVSHGLDPRLLARIGAIPRDSANLTAAAFRDGQPHQSGATSSAPEALAVALRGPSGPVGVLSAELQPQHDVAEAVDLATIFAAQIAPLVLQTQFAPAEIPQRRQA
jgi:hypothetical protein